MASGLDHAGATPTGDARVPRCSRCKTSRVRGGRRSRCVRLPRLNRRTRPGAKRGLRIVEGRFGPCDTSGPRRPGRPSASRCAGSRARSARPGAVRSGQWRSDLRLERPTCHRPESRRDWGCSDLLSRRDRQRDRNRTHIGARRRGLESRSLGNSDPADAPSSMRSRSLGRVEAALRPAPRELLTRNPRDPARVLDLSGERSTVLMT